MTFWSVVVQARTIDVAVIESPTVEGAGTNINQLFKDELLALLEGDYHVNFISYTLNPSAQLSDVDVQLDKAYQNPKVQMVLVTDLAANQMIGLRPSFPKPTFLPIVINAELLGYPVSGEASGKENLHYLTEHYDFKKELGALKTIAPFSRAILIGEKKVAQSLGPNMLADIKRQSREAGVDLRFLLYDGNYEQLIASIPSDIEAVLVTSISGASNDEMQSLIEEINKRKLFSFSITGDELVRKGIFASNSPDTDWRKSARQNALNMQAVLLEEERIENLPVFFESSSRVIINMETARQIRYAPSFNILSEAVLINEENTAQKLVYSLTDVANKAVKVNLSIAIQQLQKEQADEGINEARGALLPQITSFLSANTRKKTDALRLGFSARSTADGTIRLTQPLYSERKWANFVIQKYAALTEKERLRQTELDIVQAAANAYLEILRAQTILDQRRYNLDITRQNLNLAENRVKVGSTNASDLYRWESELASAQSTVLSAKSSVERARQNLNRLLNRPINENFSTSVETLDNPALLISDKRLTDLIDNTYALDALTNLFVERGLDLSPELKQVTAQIASNKRALQRDQRAYWLPEFNLTGQYSHNINEDRAVGGIAAEKNDWQVGVELSLPLFEGGSRYARTAKSRLAVRQQTVRYQDTRNTIETNIRNAMESLNASYDTIDLAKRAEKASQKNYDLVSQSYGQGAVSITNLLDSQTSLISARESSMNAVHSFLIDLMNLQRAIGAFDFFLTDSQKIDFSEELINRVKATNAR